MTHALVRTGLTTVICAGALWAGSAAGASTAPFGGRGGGNHTGNGSHNRNSVIINSPNASHDVQHVRNIDVSGITITPAAVCKRTAHRCKIVQKVLFIDP